MWVVVSLPMWVVALIFLLAGIGNVINFFKEPAALSIFSKSLPDALLNLAAASLVGAAAAWIAGA